MGPSGKMFKINRHLCIDPVVMDLLKLRKVTEFDYPFLYSHIDVTLLNDNI